ncbi:MAG: hypothetical protein QM811_00805 [Pirellulales bacterium]
MAITISGVLNLFVAFGGLYTSVPANRVFIFGLLTAFFVAQLTLNLCAYAAWRRTRARDLT